MADEAPSQEKQPKRKSSWELEEGDEIVPGRYAFKVLGGGTNYEAYLAWDDHLFSLVAVKVVRPDLATSKSALRTLKTESELLGRLNHPVVVRSFGAVLEPPRPHVVLEYLEGPPLSTLIRKYGPLPMEQLLPLALQLCSALHYLSQEEIVHLDVKPRNIIMGAPPRLIDMSVARTFARAKRINGHVGTDLYMAPEQCRPEPKLIGPPADVFGLGATLFHAATGSKPWTRPDGYDASQPEQRFPQLSEPPAEFPKKQIPPRFAEVVRSCIAPDPSDRPTVAEVAGALEGMVAALPRKPLLGRMRPRFSR